MRSILNYVRLFFLSLTFVLGFLNYNWLIYVSVILLITEIFFINEIYKSSDNELKNGQYKAFKNTFQIFICSVIGYALTNQFNSELTFSKFSLIQYSLFLSICYNIIFMIEKRGNEVLTLKNKKTKFIYLIASFLILIVFCLRFFDKI